MKSTGMTDCYRIIDQGVFGTGSIVEERKKLNENEKGKRKGN